MVIYFLVNLFYLYSIPSGQMKGVISVAGLAAGKAFGAGADTLVSVMVGFALFSSLSASIILGPRVYYAMGREGRFFRFAGEIHPRFNVPAKSVLLQGMIASLMVLFGTFDQILTYMGFSLGIFPLLAVAGIFKLRRKNLSAFRSPGFPIVQIVYLFFGFSILALAYLERPVESSIALVTVAAGVPFFWIFKGRAG
jgi:APA family basic amino acid/polyamine antiporter